MRRFVPLVLLLVPLLYGATYLWANWDPYGRLDRVPVAVVNADRPVDSRGEHIDAGNQFVQQLRADGLFDWRFVDRERARDGLREGEFYFTVEVPPDFSERLASAGETNPSRAVLLLTKNDANGYIAGIMADTVQAQLQNQINAAAHASYARSLYGELDRAREKLLLASQASDQLVRGTDLGAQGTESLAGGLNGIRGGVGQVSRGADGVSQATEQLDRQLSSVADFSTEQLPGAVNALVNASSTAVGNLSRIQATTAALTARAESGVAALDDLRAAHPDLAGDGAYRQALDSARGVADAATTADRDARQALSTAQEANQRALSVQSSMGPLQERMRSLTAPVDSLRDGTAELAAGTAGLTGGLDTLAGGSGVLEQGAGQLNEGARGLRGLVNDTLQRIPPTNPTEVSRAADVLGSPTQIHTGNLNPALVYGRGLAPFFFGIALWVFGLLAYLLLRPVNTRALAQRIAAPTIALAGFLPAAALGVAGGLVLYGVVDLGLGLAPLHPGWTIGLVSLASMAFTAVDQLLRSAFGAIGGLVSLVLLIVQLTASGGLYPMETTPVPFQAVHPYLPMSYLVDGLRVTISGGEVAHLVRDLLVLGGVLVGALVLTSLVVMRLRTWTTSRLHPQVDL
nr:YhgE/Pip domain-containing protein [Saccharopolyspora sp. HNM0983]